MRESSSSADILTSTTFTPTIEETFDFWIPKDQEVSEDAAVSMDDANASIAPTVKLDAADSMYWCLINDRAFIRWILPHDENKALDALARVISQDASKLADNDGEGRLLGAFRACGVLTPVWEVSTQREPAAQNAAMKTVVEAYEAALASLENTPLTAEERRSRSGLVSRQITLR